MEPVRIEGPEWYRNYHREDWQEPDSQEQRMMDGSRGYGEWPAELREIHAHRRWEEAKYAYRQEHPALAEQEFGDLVGEEARARRAERRGDYTT